MIYGYRRVERFPSNMWWFNWVTKNMANKEDRYLVLKTELENDTDSKSFKEFSINKNIARPEMTNFLKRYKNEYPLEYLWTKDWIEYRNTLSDKLTKPELDKRLDYSKLMKEFKENLNEKIETKISEKLDVLINKMEDDIITGKTMLIQSAVLGIAWYFAQMKDRVENGKAVSINEVKTLYEIMKIELNEPIWITENRTKSVSIKIDMPISQDDIHKILKNNIRQDLNINVEDMPAQIREKVDKILPIVEKPYGKPAS